MTTQELLAELDRRGVTLTLTDASLRYHPRSAVDADLLEALTAHKAALRDALLAARADELLARCDGSSAWAIEWARLHDRWGVPCHAFATWAAWARDVARTLPAAPT